MFYELDVRTLMVILIWGSLATVVLFCSFQFLNKSSSGHRLGKYFSCAKICFAFAMVLILFRETIPDFLSVHVGNTVLLIGFYLEALSIFSVSQITNKKIPVFTTTIFILSVLVFNIIEMVMPNASNRVVIASLCVFFIMAVPSVHLMLFPGNSYFKRLVGIFYMSFLCMLLPRAIYSLIYKETSVFTNFTFQCLTFLSLVLLMIISSSVYLLIMKEEEGKTIRILATTDYLTGLSNRHSFFEMALILFEKNRQEGIPLAVIFFDIDHFKQVNDTYGHAFGDQVLIRFAQIIKSNLRSCDLSCRYGGEEIMVLLSGIDVSTTHEIAERVMNETRKAVFERCLGFHFTVSAGVYHDKPKIHDTLEAFINRADQAMYQAKENGRDRIEAYTPECEELEHVAEKEVLKTKGFVL